MGPFHGWVDADRVKEVHMVCKANRGLMKLFGNSAASIGDGPPRRDRLATFFWASILNSDPDMEIGNQAVTTLVRGG